MKKKKKDKVNAKALKKFIQNFHVGESLTLQEAERNLHSGLVEIIWNNGQHAANGLLITQDGFFLTCDHCSNDGNIKFQSVRDSSGRIYRIKGIKVNGEKSDVTLAKIDLSAPKEPCIYKFSTERDLAEKRSVALMARRKGKLIGK